jgi:hypothetical protein
MTRLLIAILTIGLVGCSSAPVQPVKTELGAAQRCQFESKKVVENGVAKSQAVEVCTEDSNLVIEKVRIGQVIREQSVAKHPVMQDYFVYKGQRCRWFLERGTHRGDSVNFQGIICETDKKMAWTVVDKF